jgi:hypothetical protein
MFLSERWVIGEKVGSPGRMVMELNRLSRNLCAKINLPIIKQWKIFNINDSPSHWNRYELYCFSC